MSESSRRLPCDASTQSDRERWAEREIGVLVYRMMHVYEHLRLAGEWVASVTGALHGIVRQIGEVPEVLEAIADARKMLRAINAEQDHAADNVSRCAGKPHSRPVKFIGGSISFLLSRNKLGSRIQQST